MTYDILAARKKELWLRSMCLPQKCQTIPSGLDPRQGDPSVWVLLEPLRGLTLSMPCRPVSKLDKQKSVSKIEQTRRERSGETWKSKKLST